MVENTSYVIHFSSWYPNEQKPYLGIFVKRHIESASQYRRQFCVHACSKVETPFSFKKKFTNRVNDHFEEQTLVYGKPKGLFDKVKRWFLVTAFYFRTYKQLVREQGKPAGIHLHICWPLCLYIWPVLWFSNCPVLITEHWTGYLPEDGRYTGRVMKFLTQKLVKRAKAILVVSEKQRDAMLSHRLNNHYHLINNVVDHYFTVSDRFHEMSNERVRLFHVSTLVEEEKNITGLLRGFSMALKNNPQLHLTLAGFETNWQKLIQNEPELKEIPVTYLGSLNAKQIASEMHKADAFMMTSWFENQPVVCIEAWCSGLPIIGVEVGNLNLTMNNQNSVKIKSQKPEDICAAIETFVNNRFVFNKKEIAHQARSQYSSAVVSKQLESLYQMYFKS